VTNYIVELLQLGYPFPPTKHKLSSCERVERDRVRSFFRFLQRVPRDEIWVTLSGPSPGEPTAPAYKMHLHRGPRVGKREKHIYIENFISEGIGEPYATEIFHKDWVNAGSIVIPLKDLSKFQVYRDWKPVLWTTYDILVSI
jgi:hypothetical protein